MDFEKEIEKHKNKCVQCCENLDYAIKIGKQEVPICYNPGCPNFGLLQSGTNFIPEGTVTYAMSPKAVKKYRRKK